MGGTRGAQFDHFGGNRVGRGGGNIDKIDKIIKLFFFLADLSNQTKSFDAAIDNSIAEVPPGRFCLNRKILAAGPCNRICHGGVHFFASTYLPEHTVRKYYSTFSTSSYVCEADMLGADRNDMTLSGPKSDMSPTCRPTQHLGPKIADTDIRQNQLVSLSSIF
jgi:hypothetical protein